MISFLFALISFDFETFHGYSSFYKFGYSSFFHMSYFYFQSGYVLKVFQHSPSVIRVQISVCVFFFLEYNKLTEGKKDSKSNTFKEI